MIQMVLEVQWKAHQTTQIFPLQIQVMFRSKRMFGTPFYRFFLLFFFSVQFLHAQILVPMDQRNQRAHLRSYGLVYSAFEQGYNCHWLLNYRGGSFAILNADQNLIREAIKRGVSYESTSEGVLLTIMESLQSPAENTNTVELQKVPKIAVYSPPGAQPWDDAVTMVLTYADIPFSTIYDQEILDGTLNDYQWLHLHHEDFTGHYG